MVSKNLHQQAQTIDLFALSWCSMSIDHWRAVRVCSRHWVDKVQLKPSWEQRISWWSSTIKRLLYVNRVNPLRVRRVTAVWFHARSTLGKRTSGQQTHGWIVTEKKGYCEKSTTDTKSLSSVNVLFLQFSFGDIFWFHVCPHSVLPFNCISVLCWNIGTQTVAQNWTTNNSWQVKNVRFLFNKDNLLDSFRLLL